MRWAAAQALGQVASGQPEVVTALLQALSDLDLDVRWTAAQALGQVASGQPEVVTALLQTISRFLPRGTLGHRSSPWQDRQWTTRGGDCSPPDNL